MSTILFRKKLAIFLIFSYKKQHQLHMNIANYPVATFVNIFQKSSRSLSYTQLLLLKLYISPTLPHADMLLTQDYIHKANALERISQIVHCRFEAVNLKYVSLIFSVI
jgi:hypothetical protein